MRIKTSLALALAGAISFSAAMGTTLDAMTVQELAARAEVAVVGKVTGTRTIQTSNGIATITSYAITNNMWGVDGVSSIEVITEGGSFKVGKFALSETSPGQALSATGSLRMLFLTQDTESGKFTVVGFNQGSLQVQKGVNGNQVILPGTGLMSLDAAMAAVKSAKLAPAEAVGTAR